MRGFPPLPIPPLPPAPMIMSSAPVRITTLDSPEPAIKSGLRRCFLSNFPIPFGEVSLLLLGLEATLQAL